jgi:uncharacterized membrane protein YbhN (UPF0104 family)
MSSLSKNTFSNVFEKFQQLFSLGKKDKDRDKSKSIWDKFKLWGAILLGITLFVILLSLISIEDLLRVLSNMNIWFFLAALVLGISSTIIKTIRFGSLFPPSGRWLKLYGIFTSLRFIYYLLPFNAGEVVYLNVLKKYKFFQTITEALPSWIFLRMTDVIALTLWLIIVVIFGDLSGELYESVQNWHSIIIGFSIGLILIIFSLPFIVSKISLEKSENWFFKKLMLLKAGLARTKGVWVFFRTIFISFVIWAALIGWHVLAQSAFNTPLAIWHKLFVSITIYLLSLIPINTPLNIGTDEAAWTGALLMSGLNLNESISIAVSMRVVSMLILFTDGLIGLTILSLKKNSDTETNRY